MKILGIFLNNELRTGGHKRYLELMEGLSLRGHEVSVYLNEDLAWAPKEFTAIRISAPYIRGKNLFLGSLFRSALARQIKGDMTAAADWILIFGETHWKAARYISGKFCIPVLFAYRSDSIQENQLYLEGPTVSLIRKIQLILEITFEKTREKKITKHASIIAFQSPSDRDRYITRNPDANDKTAVIRGDIRQPRFKPEFALKNTSSRCERLLFVGTLGKRKGLEFLLYGLAHALGKGCANIHLDILAAGINFAPFEKIILEKNLSAHVTFHGKVAEPLPFMVRSDLLVVPSLFDSYPNVVLEALHTGLPVIGSRSGGIPDMLAEDTLMFAPSSPNEIGTKITELYMSPEKYSEARKLCSSRRSYFDFDWAQEWEKILNASSLTKGNMP